MDYSTSNYACIFLQNIPLLTMYLTEITHTYTKMLCTKNISEELFVTVKGYKVPECSFIASY